MDEVIKETKYILFLNCKAEFYKSVKDYDNKIVTTPKLKEAKSWKTYIGAEEWASLAMFDGFEPQIMTLEFEMTITPVGLSDIITRNQVAVRREEQHTAQFIDTISEASKKAEEEWKKQQGF